MAGKFLELDTLGRRECSPLGELGSGEPGMERDWGVLEVDNLGVLERGQQGLKQTLMIEAKSAR